MNLFSRSLIHGLKLVWSTYPAWGGTEGGWHGGISYWSGYMRRMVRVVHEFDLYGIPLKDKPFFSNTGYFGIYAAYPGRPTPAGLTFNQHTGFDPPVEDLDTVDDYMNELIDLEFEIYFEFCFSNARIYHDLYIILHIIKGI